MEDKKLIKAALLEWINGNEYDENTPAIVTGDKSYTLKQLKDEIENETDFGEQVAKDLVALTIDLLLRKKRTLP